MCAIWVQVDYSFLLITGVDQKFSMAVFSPTPE